MRISRILFLCAAFLFIGGACDASAQSDDCEVEKILESKELPSGALTVDGYDNVTEASYLLVPVSLEKGRYEITVSQESDNLYYVEGQNLYLRTSLCLELATMSDAILEVQSSKYGFGNLYFLQ
mgnify:CR=1 FL=1